MPVQFKTLVRCALLLLLWLNSPLAQAGSIGFSVGYSAEQISLVNVGSESAYRVTLWTLGPTLKWQLLQIVSGNADTLAPAQTLKGRRLAPAPDLGLGRHDPLLLVFYDQAGGRIAQLAWRQSPPVARHLLATQRQGALLTVQAGDASVVATYGIAVPYEGIARLSRAFVAGAPAPDPLRVAWTPGATLTLDTGAGQGGAWLVHETAAGALEVQIVGDGMARGQEQIPVWLAWARLHLLKLASAVAALGAALVVLGLIASARRTHRRAEP